MERKFQIGNTLALHDAQRVEGCPLVTTHAIGSDQPQQVDLLAFVFGGNRFTGGPGNTGSGALANFEKLLLQGGIGRFRFFKLPRQVTKVALPLLRNRLRIGKVGLVQLLNVGKITPLQMRAAPHLLHDTVLHVTSPDLNIPAPSTGLTLACQLAV